MSIEYSNSWNSNKMYQASENLHNYIDSGEIVNSKIRKFFFVLQNKQIERDLRVTISVKTGDKVCDQIILIELTNDANPVFLFVLGITKDDFEILRKDQGLNVEFQNFPQALVNLLEQCDGDTENGGRFKLMLVDYCGTAAGGRIMDMNKIQVKIIEECAFKNICHLTLDILRGSELQIRQKLEAEVYKIKQSLLKTSKSHDEALIKISDLVEQINEKNKVIEKSSVVANDLIVQKDEECHKIRNQAERQEKVLREEFNEKINEERKQFEKQLLLMQNKIDIFEKELRSFHDKELEMQNLIHEKERDKELMEVELISKKQEIHQLRSQNEKLDCDYHEKEKAVNILRTRLAVTEQELKDNNTLLLNHQNKLDETVEEKKKLQTRLDIIHNKLDRKEVALKNLSDEIIKANDIIAKQQLKLNIFSAKVKDFESTNSKLEETLKAKDIDLCKQIEIVNKLQSEIALLNTESDQLKKKVDILQKTETELNNELINKSKTVTALRGNFDDLLAEFQLDSPQKSLLTYRTYLSMPTLLPSDNRRYTDTLWDFMMEYRTSNDLSHIDPATKSFKLLRIIKPYIYRYLKRFQSIPLSLFKSGDAPLTVLVSPRELQSLHDGYLQKDQSEDNINNATEYAMYNTTESYPSTVHSDTLIDKVKGVVCSKPNVRKLNKTVEKNVGNYYHFNTRLFENSESNNYKDFGLGEGSSKPPNYAPVGAFRLKPFERTQRMPSSGIYVANRHLKGEYQRATTSNPRKTPAVGAPPLTPQQRNAIDSVFKTSRSRYLGNQKNSLLNTPQNTTSTYKPTVESDKIYSPSTLNEMLPVHINKCAYSPDGNTNIIDTKSISQTSKECQKLLEPGFITDNKNSSHDIPELVSISKLKNSIDLPEPSAYFAN